MPHKSPWIVSQSYYPNDTKWNTFPEKNNKALLSEALESEGFILTFATE